MVSSTRRKGAVIQELGDNELQIEIVRMIEENNSVFAECNVRVLMKEGGSLVFRARNIYDLEDGKVKRMSSFVIEPKDAP